MKPTGMLEDALLDLSNRGDLVLDPFLGSGSTLIAAQNTGRICYGIGLEIARTLRMAGASVFIADLDLEKTKKAAASVGEDVKAFRCDVTDVQSVRELTVAIGSCPDIVVNNAGVARVAPRRPAMGDHRMRGTATRTQPAGSTVGKIDDGLAQSAAHAARVRKKLWALELMLKAIDDENREPVDLILIEIQSEQCELIEGLARIGEQKREGQAVRH